MDQVVRLRLSEDEKALWVQAAHGELVTLSEWVRRACAARAGLAAGDSGVPERLIGDAAIDGGASGPALRKRQPSVGSNPTAGSPAASPRPFRPDFKK